MKYQFDFKTQITYGALGFILALGIIYLLTGKINWISSAVVGAINFLVAGFYKNLFKKTCN